MNRILFHTVMVFIIHIIIFSCIALYGTITTNQNFLDIFVRALQFIAEPLCYAFFSTRYIMWFFKALVLLINGCFILKQHKYTTLFFYFCNIIIIGFPGAMFIYLVSVRMPGDGAEIY